MNRTIILILAVCFLAGTTMAGYGSNGIYGAGWALLIGAFLTFIFLATIGMLDDD